MQATPPKAVYFTGPSRDAPFCRQWRIEFEREGVVNWRMEEERGGDRRGDGRDDDDDVSFNSG